MPKAIQWGSPEAHAFTTNVSLVTSTGPNGPNIMACEWTFQVSYDPGAIAISVGNGKATYENILATKEFSIALAAEDQSVLASVAGGSSGRATDKIAALKALGFTFVPGKSIEAPFPEGAALVAECTLISVVDAGDHTVFIGRVERVTRGTKPALVYHQGAYRKVGESIAKPAPAELERINAAVAQHAR